MGGTGLGTYWAASSRDQRAAAVPSESRASTQRDPFPDSSSFQKGALGLEPVGEKLARLEGGVAVR